jgi:MOSC domain-containing protein YiiM
MKKEFKIISINISKERGVPKNPVNKAILKENFGIVGDGHAGSKLKQVSLLASEDIKMLKKKLPPEITYGDFAENISTEGIDIQNLKIGDIIYLGDVILEITQKGKYIHHDSLIYKTVGDGGLPKRGAFAKVIKGGEITNESYCYYYIRPSL